MKKGVKFENIIIQKHFVTDKELNRGSLLNIIFSADDFDGKKMEFHGKYEIEYKGIRYECSGIYNLGSDIRTGLVGILKENFHLDFILNSSNSKEMGVLLDILNESAPKYQQFY